MILYRRPVFVSTLLVVACAADVDGVLASLRAEMQELRLAQREEQAKREQMQEELKELRARVSTQGRPAAASATSADGNAAGRTTALQSSGERQLSSSAKTIGARAWQTHVFPAGHSCLNVDDPNLKSLLPVSDAGEVTWVPMPTDLPAEANLTLGSIGSDWSTNEIQSFPVPLKVVHAADCASHPTLELPLDTSVPGALTVAGWDVASALKWLHAFANVGGGGAVGLQSSNGKYLSMGYHADVSTADLAGSIAAYETFRIVPAPFQTFCIYTTHDANAFNKLLVPKTDGSTASIVANAAEDCTVNRRWEISVPATTDDGTDWATATGDAEKVVLKSVGENKYLSRSSDTQAMFTTSLTAEAAWKVIYSQGF